VDSKKNNPMPIEQVRVEIDRVDNALLDLIAERLELAAAVRRAKSGVRVWRPSREDSHVRDLAGRTGHASPSLVSKIWAELMSASLSALAKAYGEDEGVAVLPAPGGMNNWWSALCPGGAMPDMHILAGLPRVGSGWPRAVAVATADVAPSGCDITLLVTQSKAAIKSLNKVCELKAEAGAFLLYAVDGYIEDMSQLTDIDPMAKVIGCLPKPLTTD